ncbi:hypothetical protein B0J13DRAFT_565000 [Dactylonectria estremocensis]|uniref:Uncharacterized protein n=1 Tax=Dactylonectria estremocensis TaxID=1079267 RepID=A0A9P9DWE0_9HYPO|nr:hypothetical protein B0J13DRAFT_565000 [Dactylonectria estremocensis]
MVCSKTNVIHCTSTVLACIVSENIAEFTSPWTGMTLEQWARLPLLENRSIGSSTPPSPPLVLLQREPNLKSGFKARSVDRYAARCSSLPSCGTSAQKETTPAKSGRISASNRRSNCRWRRSMCYCEERRSSRSSQRVPVFMAQVGPSSLALAPGTMRSIVCLPPR